MHSTNPRAGLLANVLLLGLLSASSSAAAAPFKCNSGEFADYKAWMSAWLAAANNGEYYKNPCPGRSSMGARMIRELPIPLEIDWASFKKFYDKGTPRQRQAITSTNLGSVCGGFWGGLAHFKDSRKAAERKKLRRKIKKAVCYLWPERMLKPNFKLVGKGKAKGTLRIGVNWYTAAYELDLIQFLLSKVL